MERKVKYNFAFKLNCVKEALQKNTSINSLSSQEGFNDRLLHKWIFDYQNKGINGFRFKEFDSKKEIQILQRGIRKNCSKCLTMSI